MKIILPVAVALSLTAGAILADDFSPVPTFDKTVCNLFQPTPDDLLRPLDSDQYDNVLDAHTLDAGHLQLETSIVNYYKVASHISSPGLNYHFAEEEYAWTPRFRVGLLNNVDFDVSPIYAMRSENINGAFSPPNVPFAFDRTSRRDAFGSVGLGPKFNLWGNDDGPTALALRPFISIPTSHGDVLGGVDMPFGWRMGFGLYLKLDSGFGLAENGRHTHFAEFQNSISLHESIGSKAEAYWYLDSNVDTDPAQTWVGYTGFGLAYSLTHNFQLFGGIGFGLSSVSYDYNPRFGVVFRY